MLQNDEQSIIDFLKQEVIQGHFESTTTEIAHGTKLSYNNVGKMLERLIIRDQVGYRERGTERKLVRYFYLTDLLDLCKKKWK
jgi:hypothetical protein